MIARPLAHRAPVVDGATQSMLTCDLCDELDLSAGEVDRARRTEELVVL